MGVIEVFFSLKVLLLPEIDTKKRKNCFVNSLKKKKTILYLYILFLTIGFTLQMIRTNTRSGLHLQEGTSELEL